MRKRDESVIPVSQRCLSWLGRVSALTQKTANPLTPAEVAASFLEAIMRDDERAHNEQSCQTCH